MTADEIEKNSYRVPAVAWIALFAAAKILFHLLTNDGYGFHRDELATIDDAKHLAWGFVAYPPVTAFFGRIALLFGGQTPSAFRFFPSVAQAIVIVLAALMARRMGGGSRAQWLAALAVAISPTSLAGSALYQYVSFDILWWVLIAFFVVRLADSDDPRWWVAIGAVIGLGVLTKYTIAFYVAGIVVGFLVTPLRKHFTSRWLWIGVAVSILIPLPHLFWQMRHEFITLDFLEHIHARDVRIGRADDFLVEQLFLAANALTIPLWAAGLGALFVSERFRRFRILGWMAVVPFVLFVIAKGRGYYMAGVYPMLLAAGAVVFVAWASERSAPVRRTLFAVAILAIVLGSAVALIVLPVTAIGTPVWNFAVKQNHDLAEEVGWPELVREVARIRATLPPDEDVGIFCGNYGEAGAVNLYGPALGLPPAISSVNSYWLRGAGKEHAPTMIVLGVDREELEKYFLSVKVAGRTPVVQGVRNEETDDHPEIYVARGMKASWITIWPKIRSFG